MENQNKKPSISKTTKRVSANGFSLRQSSGGRKIAPGSAKKTSGAGGTSKSKSSVAKTVAAATAVAGTAYAAKKAVKSIGLKPLVTAVICLIISLILGAGVCFIVGKNDRFDIVGNEELSLTLTETYIDQGVDIREFGLNLSGKAVTETNLKRNEKGEYYAEEAGTYYIIYTVKSVKFGFIYPTQKIRLITFVEPSEGDFVDDTIAV